MNGSPVLKTENKKLIELASSMSVHEGCVSMSLLQRRFRIGYGRARSLLNSLVEVGCVGEGNPRGLCHAAVGRQEGIAYSSAETFARMVYGLALCLVEK